MKKMLVMAFVMLLSASTVNAATVTWSSKLLASDGSNVLTAGIEHVGVSYGSNPDDSRVINGVNFKANDEAGNHDNPAWSGWINDRNGSAVRYGAAGTDLKELTNDIVYGGTLVLGINNLTVGKKYRIQLISYDASNWWNSPKEAIERWQTIRASGDLGFDFQHGTGSPYAGINDVGAALVIGTWTADATEIDFTVSSRALNDNAIINGFVVQDISPRAVNVEPIAGAGGVSVTSSLRWRIPRDPNNSELQYPDTASFIVYCDPNEKRLKAATYDSHAGVPYYRDQLLAGSIGEDLIQSYDPDPDLAINTTYYWRVDTRLAAAAEPNDILVGTIWVFNTDAKPVIDIQPADQFLYDTENAVFTVVATDPTGGGLSYQWYRNGTDPKNAMEGEIASTLTLTNPLAGLDQGFYTCRITNSGGDTWTRSARLVIKSLVNHWMMDGDAVDSAGQYDGTLVGDPNWVAGIVGPGSIKLDNADGIIVILDENIPPVAGNLLSAPGSGPSPGRDGPAYSKTGLTV
ncbi:MAG TPA: immunoglobulin domain-containing protein [Anaerohalosphaeraceae bacterium]|nr:immunoglobulin domain-containing protein [Anaerohalosphaeraceae bacterium]